MEVIFTMSNLSTVESPEPTDKTLMIKTSELYPILEKVGVYLARRQPSICPNWQLKKGNCERDDCEFCNLASLVDSLLRIYAFKQFETTDRVITSEDTLSDKKETLTKKDLHTVDVFYKKDKFLIIANSKYVYYIDSNNVIKVLFRDEKEYGGQRKIAMWLVKNWPEDIPTQWRDTISREINMQHYCPDFS